MNLNFGEKYVLARKFAIRFYNDFFNQDVLSSSAQVAFYLSFALFPMLFFLVSLFGIIVNQADDLRLELFSYLRQIMPYSAYILVQKTILEVSENSSGGKITVGLLVALWSSSAGIDSLRIAINGVYGLKERRNWFKTKAISLTMTIVLIVLISFVIGTVFYGWKFLSVLLNSLNLPIESVIFLQIIQWITFIFVLFAMFGLLYNFLPNKPKRDYHWISWGALVAICLWILLTGGFRFYLHFFNNYDKTYGSLGAVIILMLWLYLTSLVILIGGLINAIIEHPIAKPLPPCDDTITN